MMCDSSKSVAVPVGRLASLDILRGFDLFLLVFLQPVIVAVGLQMDADWMDAVLYQFDHEVWEGFRAWDIVMPLFLFMTGAAMPFSLGKYAGRGATRCVYWKIIRRFVLLYLCGMLVQGNLLGFDYRYIYLYSNTLQAIAVGYLIGAFAMLWCRPQRQLWVVTALFVLYTVPMVVCGDYTPQGNFAEMVDRAVLGRFRDGVWWDEAGIWHFSSDYCYTWVWSSLTFAVTVMLGAWAGRIMKQGSADKTMAAVRLAIIGVGLTAAGVLLGIEIPIIKRIWSSSMTLFSGGICFLLMALAYFLIDCRGYSRGLNWLKIYGMNSITAYLLGEVVNFRCIVASVSYGLEKYLGGYYDVWLTTGNYFIVMLILAWMYRCRVFLKL